METERRPANHQRIASSLIFACIMFAQDSDASISNQDWRSETLIFISGVRDYSSQRGDSQNHEAVVLATELKFLDDSADKADGNNRPFIVSLFAEYRISGSARFNNSYAGGGYFRYDIQDWDSTAYIFSHKTPGYSHRWKYAGRIRYRFADRHKAGIEFVAPIRGGGSPQLLLGYYRSIADSLTLKVFADPGLNSGPDRGARLVLVWQLR